MGADTPPLEAVIVKAILRRMRLEPGMWVDKTQGTRGKAGMPDLIGCYCGRMFGIEVKRPGRPHKLSRLQEVMLQKMANAGALVAVVESVTDVEELFGWPAS